MFATPLIGPLVVASVSGAASSQPASRPSEWGELFRWLRVATVVRSTQPVVGRPCRVSIWAEAVGKTARLLPEGVSVFCLVRAGQERYFSQRLRPKDPVTLEMGRPVCLLTVDLSERLFYVYEPKLKLTDGYPTARPGQVPPKLAGPGGNLLKIGRHAMQFFVYAAGGDGRPEALARSTAIKFEVVPATPVGLTAEQQKVYDRLAPKFRRGVVSASKAAPEAVRIGAAAVPALRALLASGEPHYARAWATDALCRIVDPAATAVLREMIRKPGLGSRDVMGYHLMPRRDRDAADLIVELLQTRRGPIPRMWVARGFVDFGRAFRGKAAELLLASEDPKVLYLCGMALRRGTFKKADTQRIFDLHGQQGLSERAAVALIDGLERADRDLHQHLFAALARLTGLEHKTVVAWQAWARKHDDDGR